MAKGSIRSGRKSPKKISKKYLENAALYYLQRYASSTENLRRVLMRKVKRSCAFHQVPAEDFAPMVDELITRYISVGLINDMIFALSFAASHYQQTSSQGTFKISN